MPTEENEQTWLPVIGRSLARITMHLAQVDGKTISDRASFLEGLGLERKEIALMLGTTPASIAELLRQRSKKDEANGKSKKSSK
jgi:hypothetical protein